jgi:hypothetical protein
MSEWSQFIAYGGSPEKRDKERKRKRDKYANDPEHREKKKAEARARYAAKRRDRIQKLRRARGRNKPKPYILPNGKTTLLIGLGATADACGISKKTLVAYEERGVIPINRLIDVNSRRWYPKEFVAFLKPLLENQSSQREPLWRLKRRVERAWQEAEGTIPILKEKNDARDEGQEGDDHQCPHHHHRVAHGEDR